MDPRIVPRMGRGPKFLSCELGRNLDRERVEGTRAVDKGEGTSQKTTMAAPRIETSAPAPVWIEPGASVPALRFDNSFVRELPGDPDRLRAVRGVRRACFSPIDPVPVTGPRLLAHSPEVARLLDLSEADCASRAFVQLMAGNALLRGMAPYAACYGGHQFGTWAGQLGDGRAISLGEAVNARGERWELQLKGAGATPYSRSADGRAVLRSSIREFLCSEAMAHLGVPTTRALSLVASSDPVVRDMFYDGHPRAETGAIVCRVAPSFLRFGNFELFAAGGEELEVAEAQERRGHAADDRARLGARMPVVEHVAHDRVRAGDQRQRARGRHTQVRHRLATEKFPDRRTQDRATVGRARKRRRARPFELQLPALAACVDGLAQRDGPAVAELTGPGAELVSAITGGVGRHAAQERVAGHELHERPRRAVRLR